MPCFPSPINSRTSQAPPLHQFIHKLASNISNFQQKQHQEAAMISPRRLAQLAKKWQRMAAIRRKMITSTAEETEGCYTSVAGKGHCVMYTADGRRFEAPLDYLGTTVFGELLRMSQEEFGFASNGRITLPCDAAALEYVMCLLRRNASAEVERAFLSSMMRTCHSESCVMPTAGTNQQFAVSSY